MSVRFAGWRCNGLESNIEYISLRSLLKYQRPSPFFQSPAVFSNASKFLFSYSHISYLSEFPKQWLNVASHSCNPNKRKGPSIDRLNDCSLDLATILIIGGSCNIGFQDALIQVLKRFMGSLLSRFPYSATFCQTSLSLSLILYVTTQRTIFIYHPPS